MRTINKCMSSMQYGLPSARKNTMWGCLMDTAEDIKVANRIPEEIFMVLILYGSLSPALCSWKPLAGPREWSTSICLNDMQSAVQIVIMPICLYV